MKNNIKILNQDEYYDTFYNLDLENKSVGFKISNKYRNITLYNYVENKKFLLEVVDEHKNTKRYEIFEDSFEKAKLEASRFYFCELNDIEEYEVIKHISLKDYLKLSFEERTKIERYLRVINIDENKNLILMNYEYYYYIDEEFKTKIDSFNFEYFVKSEL